MENPILYYKLENPVMKCQIQVQNNSLAEETYFR